MDCGVLARALPEWQVVCEQQKETRNSHRGDEGHSGQILCPTACGPRGAVYCVCVCLCVCCGVVEPFYWHIGTLVP